MRRQGALVPLRSCEGIVMRHIKRCDAFAIATDPDSGFEFSRNHKGEVDGIIAKDFRQPRDSSPTSITLFDMKANAGLLGEPLPEDQRRNGYIDPIESALDKVSCWQDIGDVKREIFAGVFCPWPRQQTSFSNVNDSNHLQLEMPVAPQVREAWLTKLGLYGTFS